MEGVLGLMSLFLGLASVGIADVALFRGLTAHYVSQLNRDERGAFARGLAVIALVALLVVILGTIAQNAPQGSPAQTATQLTIGLLGLLVGLAFLVGYGALAWRVGERVLHIFGAVEPTPGWCVLVGTLLIVVVVWVPLLGWALGLYWLMLTVGAVIQRLFGGLTAEPTVPPTEAP